MDEQKATQVPKWMKKTCQMNEQNETTVPNQQTI